LVAIGFCIFSSFIFISFAERDNQQVNARLASDSFSAKGNITGLSYSRALSITKAVNNNDTSLNNNNNNNNVNNVNNSRPVPQQNLPSFSSVGRLVDSSGIGNWNLSINNGKLTNFISRFTISSRDGSDRNTFEITNFTTTNANKLVKLNPDGTVLMRGTTDLKINDKIKLTGIYTTIIITKLRTISIIPDPLKTSTQFRGLEIQGVTLAFKDQNGQEMLK
jgi:hypothetical protein